MCSPRMHERIIILGDDDDGPEFNAIRWSERNEASPKPGALSCGMGWYGGVVRCCCSSRRRRQRVGDDLGHGVLDRLLLPPRR